MNDNYPPGLNPTCSLELVEQKCHNCKNTWQAAMWFELGGWFYEAESDAFCPSCGHESDGGLFVEKCCVCITEDIDDRAVT